jgi:hypothetical protein
LRFLELKFGRVERNVVQVHVFDFLLLLILERLWKGEYLIEIFINYCFFNILLKEDPVMWKKKLFTVN